MSRERDKKSKKEQQEQLLPFGEETTSLREISVDTFYEMNLIRLPFCFLDRHKKGTYSVIEIPIITRYGRGRWKVSPNVELGAAGPLEDSVLMAIFKIISKLPKPARNPIDIGSLRQFCKIARVERSRLPDVKEALLRLASLLCTSEMAYYRRDYQRYMAGVEGVFHIIDKVRFKNEDLGNGERCETNEVWLNEGVLENFNGGYACPFDSQLYFELKRPASRAFFKRFQAIFFASGDEPYIKNKYTTICKSTTLTPQPRLALAEQQCKPAFIELQEQGIVESYRFEKIPGVKGDWMVFIHKGPRYLKYYENYKKTHDVNQLTAEEQNGNPKLPLLTPDGVSAVSALDPETIKEQLINLGIDKPEADKLVANNDLEKIEGCIFKFKVKSSSRKLTPGYLRNMIVDSKPDEINAFVQRELRKEEKRKVAISRVKEREELEQLYLDTRQKDVEAAKSAMPQEDLDELKKEIRARVRPTGIESIDRATLEDEIEKIIAAKIGFPDEKEWVKQYYKERGKSSL